MSNKASIAALVISILCLCCSVICLCVMLGANNAAPAEPEPAAAEESGTMQFVMYVGTNDKDTYKPEFSQDEAKEIVDTVCLKYFPDGYTLQEAVGAWTEENSNITHEYTLVCYFDGADIGTVHKAADELIEKLNQNTLLIEQDTINIDFYSGTK